jgi:hypothetical protein
VQRGTEVILTYLVHHLTTRLSIAGKKGLGAPGLCRTRKGKERRIQDKLSHNNTLFTLVVAR